MKKEDKYDRFLKTYSGQKLLKKHSLDEDGVWRILGEDPNCDLSGYHHSPELETVTGRLEDVIRYAVTLNGFWQWGAGGDIRKQGSPTRIDAAHNRAREADARRIAELEAELKRLKQRNGL